MKVRTHGARERSETGGFSLDVRTNGRRSGIRWGGECTLASVSWRARVVMGFLVVGLSFVPGCGGDGTDHTESDPPSRNATGGTPPTGTTGATAPSFYAECDEMVAAIGHSSAVDVWYAQADQFSQMPEVESKPLDQLSPDEAWPIFKSLQERWIVCDLTIPKPAMAFIRAGDRLYS